MKPHRPDIEGFLDEAVKKQKEEKAVVEASACLFLVALAVVPPAVGGGIGMIRWGFGGLILGVGIGLGLAIVSVLLLLSWEQRKKKRA